MQAEAALLGPMADLALLAPVVAVLLAMLEMAVTAQQGTAPLGQAVVAVAALVENGLVAASALLEDKGAMAAV
jgi:hypothetical protein|tara:strand:+ start:496 stop:714 length:219 start_codon:yes stop_codon:yes gene_type:complete